MMTIDFSKLDQQIEDHNSHNKIEIYEYMKAQLKNGDNSEVLWRLAKLSLILSGAADYQKNKEQTVKYTEEALHYSGKSVQLDVDNVNCHKWYCASLGRMTKFVGTKEKVKYVQKFKQHIDIAFKMNPNDYFLHYMFGRFCYELANLSWIERKIATTLFGTLPKTTFDEAFKHFIDCDRLKPQWKDCYLWVAKTLIKLNRPKDAKKWVIAGLDLKTNNILDKMSNNGLTQLKTDNKF